MATWDAWTPDVAIEVPGCPSSTIEWAVRRAVIDFCERSHYITRTADPINVTSGAAARSFGSPLIASGERVVGVKEAWLNDEPLNLKTVTEVAELWPDWKTVLGTPQYFVMERSDAYWLVPGSADAITAGLRLKIAVAPTETATSCDDTIFADWRDAIASGAKARLFSMAKQPWTDPGLAAVHMTMYEGAVGAASVAAVRSPTRAKLTVKPHFF